MLRDNVRQTAQLANELLGVEPFRCGTFHILGKERCWQGGDRADPSVVMSGVTIPGS